MMIKKFQSFLAAESGATAIEYALIALLVAVAIIGSFAVLGGNLTALFDNGASEALARRPGD